MCFKVQRNWIEYAATFFATLVILASGMHIGWVGPTLLQLTSSNSTHIRITSTEASWLAGSLPLGALFGPILGSILIDNIGRKTVILLTALPFLTAWLLIILADNVYYLYIGQFFAGIGMSVSYTVAPIYIGEISSPKIRGFLGAFITIQFNLGSLLESILVPQVSLRINAFIAAIVPIIFFCTFVWMPESPYYYLLENQSGQARKRLERLTGSEQTADERLKVMQKAVENQKTDQAKFSSLFKLKNNRLALTIVIGIFTFHEFSGAVIVVTYAQVVFDKTGSPISANLSGIILACVALMCRFAICFLIDSWGRRPLLILSFSTTTIPLVMIGFFFHMQSLNVAYLDSITLIPIIGFILFTVTFSVGLATLPHIIIGEMFATNIKRYATGFVGTYQSIVGCAFVLLFQPLSVMLGIHTLFYFFAACCALGGLFVYICVPETKGKTLEDIQKSLKFK